jgi:hypothetical protein
MMDEGDTDMMDEDLNDIPAHYAHSALTVKSHSPLPPQLCSSSYAKSDVCDDHDEKDSNIYEYDPVTEPTPVAHDGYGCDSLDRHSWHVKSSTGTSPKKNGGRRRNSHQRYRPQRRGSVTKFSIQAAHKAIQSFVVETSTTTNAGHPHLQQQRQRNILEMTTFPRRVSEYSQEENWFPSSSSLNSSSSSTNAFLF